MNERRRVELDACDWPNREFSRFLSAGGVRWHVQVAGSGPCVLLLIHGTGASGHSWRAFLQPFMERCTVVIPDLPGHGFSEQPRDRRVMSLPGMARALDDLCSELALDPAAPRVVVGHSAGAAIAMRAALDGQAPSAIISLCGALLPFPGLAGHVMTPMARGMARLAFVADTFAWHVRSDRTVIRELLRQTGSQLDAQGVERYQYLAANREHVQAALDMMAAWDLHALARDLPQLNVPSILVGAERDGTVPPRQATAAARHIRGARTLTLRDLGHLAHEESPTRVGKLLGEVLDGIATGSG